MHPGLQSYSRNPHWSGRARDAKVAKGAANFGLAEFYGLYPRWLVPAVYRLGVWTPIGALNLGPIPANGVKIFGVDLQSKTKGQ
jgi:hypothetical protein